MANEKRLIDANALEELIFRRSGNMKDTWSSSAVLLAVECQPTVDAVEVVRCKDCVHMSDRFNARFCDVWCMFNGMGDEGFCNYGERKDNA